MGRRSTRAALCASWLCATGFSPPAQDQEQGPEAAPAPPGPAATDAASHPKATKGARPEKAPKLRLTVDAGLLADSNVANSSYEAERLARAGSDSNAGPLKPQGGIGRTIAAAASLRLPVRQGVTLAIDADAYVLDYDGRFADDAGVTVSGGAEVVIDRDTSALIQASASDRWYGHVLAGSSVGLRAQLRHRVQEGQQLTLALDARSLSSDYGEMLSGHELSLTATYDITLNPNLTVGLGAYGRRDWLKGSAYANTDVGAFGALNGYLGPNLLAGLYGGLSHARFDAPDPFLSPQSRTDWRWYGGVYLTTRKPLFLGVFPNLSYTYSQTASTVPFYRAERHRARLGLRRTF
jgi:hypothetical protein